MTFEEKVGRAYELRKEASEIERRKGELNARAKEIEAEVEAINASILSDMKDIGAVESKVGDIFVNVLRRESIGYDDADSVIAYLESNGLDRLIRVKREINKMAINKEVKLNKPLAEALAKMTSRKVTEYVVVTDSESHQSMLEHIAKGAGE